MAMAYTKLTTDASGPQSSSSNNIISIRLGQIFDRGRLLVLVLVATFLGFLLWQAGFAERVAIDLPYLNSEYHQYGAFDEPGDQYLLGIGKADITGPVVEINMMGYADTKQVGTGLRQRLYSRAFIIGDVTKPSDRFIYLVLDTQSGDTAIRYGILRGIAALGKEYAIYGHQNVAVTGTHSHSGPGAWLNYLLPQITSKGFDKQSYQAIVDGAVLSVKRAHECLQPGYLRIGHTKVAGANINRSLYSYLANPLDERSRHNNSLLEDGSVEKTLTLLRFQRAIDMKFTGVLTWFPTHGTSMLGNNTLISGDNKGVAADLFEKTASKEESATHDFVAGFSQANVGDVSPNVLGAWCEDGSNRQCSFENSTCSDGRSQSCHARGPLFRIKDNGASSCFEIGKRQFEPAKALFDELSNKGITVVGPSVKSFHIFQDMSNYTFKLDNGTNVHTCPAALGVSFAAGTSDQAGKFDFTQNNPSDSKASPLWTVVRDFLHDPSEAQIQCHVPKPILLDVGEITRPYLWTPNIVDVQTFRVGQLYIVVSPGEATTMAGRRWKEAVYKRATTVADSNIVKADPVVVIGGPGNTYAHYITTPEEYDIQRYEGASTLFGRHTLDAYIGLTLSNFGYLSPQANSAPPSGPLPPDNYNSSLSFITGVVADNPPIFHSFGDIKVDVHRTYERGDPVSATFVAANPRNNLRLEQTYAMVERWSEADKNWIATKDDSDWSLIFKWRRTNTVLGNSEAIIIWETEQQDMPGLYRLHYFGDSKAAFGGKISAFEGVSGVFRLI